VKAFFQQEAFSEIALILKCNNYDGLLDPHKGLTPHGHASESLAHQLP
jgi:hypothetical protein